MPSDSIRNHCHINTNYDADTFVGIKCDDGFFSINFPLGFDLSSDERGLRKDILLLINTISSTTRQMESKLLKSAATYDDEGFPFQSYIYVLSDYFVHGYYKEREQKYHISKKGKIDWNRTIKTQKPYVQNGNAFYLDFVTRKESIKENELITLIHEYCVYDAMQKIGWLFTANEPQKPRIKLNRELFSSTIKIKIRETFNDRKRMLFRNMLAIVEHMQDEDAPIYYKCGTNRFEYVWETLVDRTFGITGKELYFPKTTWNLRLTCYDNACLEPDTIMITRGNIYVLDAKYYKYGAREPGAFPKPGDLPESTSINKQITYGEYIAEENKFKMIHGNDYKTYNAFIMPFNKKMWNSDSAYMSIGTATSNWKLGLKEYETIVGVLVDIKHLMKRGGYESEEIQLLSEVIEKEFAEK